MRPRAEGAWEAGSWLALAVAFSPTLVDLARHAAAAPADRVIVLAPLLLGLCLAAGDGARGARAPGRGAALLAAALILELGGVAAASWSLARLGLPLGCLGLALWHGRPSPAAMLLLFGIVPVPTALRTATSPDLEAALAGAAASALTLLRAGVSLRGTLFESGEVRLSLHPSDAGWPLAQTLALLGFYGALRAGRGVGRAVLCAGLAAAAALPLQIAALAVAGLLVAEGAADTARRWLDLGPAVLVILPALAGIAWRARRSRARHGPA